MAINMLTLGIRCTCIILRHIPSWFEAVLAIAILQSCAQVGPKWPFWGQKWPNMAGLPRSKSGLKGSKMIPNDQYNMFLTIWGHFGIIPLWSDWFYNVKTQKTLFLQNSQSEMAKIENIHCTICTQPISSSWQNALPPAFATLEQRGVWCYVSRPCALTCLLIQASSIVDSGHNQCFLI